MRGRSDPNDAATELGRVLYAAIRAAVRDGIRDAGASPAAQDQPLAIKPAQAARMLGVSPQKMYDMLRQGQVPGFKVGDRWLINTKRLQALIDERTD